MINRELHKPHITRVTTSAGIIVLDHRKTCALNSQRVDVSQNVFQLSRIEAMRYFRLGSSMFDDRTASHE